eukprot:TRINITY_DN3288_c0_g2_i1.p1 TRINITY_DN3288_c0_g2~~TRINITY_DN3288_c0_g2_i1.p1  ORF type:complete len:453 (+),score=63.87 TRINITY_DN3288_c0_g2_i1:93-1361(+)
MATMKVFSCKGSGYLTPDPPVLSRSDESGKTMQDMVDPPEESGSQTPRFIREVNIGALQSKLERLQTENGENLLDCSKGPPPGLSNSSQDADVMKVTMSTNLQPPYPAFAVPPPPVPHPELEFVRKDRAPAMKAKPVMSHVVQKQVVSKGSVGHPFKCAPACKYVKRKGGCRVGEDCPSCHHCFWSKTRATPEEEGPSLAVPQGKDARLREAQTLANKLVSLLGGAEPFDVKAQETVKPKMSLGTTGHPHTWAEPCKYVGRSGGCMHGKACTNCHACMWSRSSGQQAEAEAPSFSGTDCGEWSRSSRQQAEAEASCFFDSFGTNHGEDVQHEQDPGCITNIEALIADPSAVPVLSTNPTWGQPQASLNPQSAPQHVPWCASVGSMGHPYTCGPACKYAAKAKGCKDGAMCDHCHLCRWSRYG